MIARAVLLALVLPAAFAYWITDRKPDPAARVQASTAKAAGSTKVANGLSASPQRPGGNADSGVKATTITGFSSANPFGPVPSGPTTSAIPQARSQQPVPSRNARAPSTGAGSDQGN
jgi:hypothetical protein